MRAAGHAGRCRGRRQDLDLVAVGVEDVDAAAERVLSRPDDLAAGCRDPVERHPQLVVGVADFPPELGEPSVGPGGDGATAAPTSIGGSGGGELATGEDGRPERLAPSDNAARAGDLVPAEHVIRESGGALRVVDVERDLPAP
jgi:hypothetical protein